MEYDIHGRLFENGLTLYHICTKSPNIGLAACVKAGSFFESPENSGISHFIEHMIFKGTYKRKDRESIYRELVSLGSMDQCNTSQMRIYWGTKVIPEDLPHALELITDLFFNSRMDSEDIEAEKAIVLDEIRNGKDDNHRLAHNLFNDTLYSGSLKSMPVIGTENTVNSFTKEQVDEEYRRLFSPSNIILFAASSMKHSKIDSMVEEAFSRYPQGCDLELPPISITGNKKAFRKACKQSSNSAYLMGRIVYPENAYALNMANTLLSNKVSEKILDKNPLSYYRYSAYYYDPYSHEIITYATFEKKNFEKVRSLILEAYDEMKNGEFTENKINDYKLFFKRSIKLEDSNLALANKAISYFLQGNIYGINIHEGLMDSVTLDDVLKEAEANFDTSRVTEILIGDY